MKICLHKEKKMSKSNAELGKLVNDNLTSLGINTPTLDSALDALC